MARGRAKSKIEEPAVIESAEPVRRSSRRQNKETQELSDPALNNKDTKSNKSNKATKSVKEVSRGKEISSKENRSSNSYGAIKISYHYSKKSKPTD